MKPEDPTQIEDATKPEDSTSPRSPGTAPPPVAAMMRRWLPLITLTGVSMAALGALWAVDDPRFASPPGDPATWRQWSGERELLDVAASLSRLLVTVALVYLICSLVAHAVALAHGSQTATRLTAKLSPAPIAALASVAVLGTSPVAAATPGADGAPGGAGGDPAPVMRLVDDDPPNTTTGPSNTQPSSTQSSNTTTHINPSNSSSSTSTPSGDTPPGNTSPSNTSDRNSSPGASTSPRTATTVPAGAAAAAGRTGSSRSDPRAPVTSTPSEVRRETSSLGAGDEAVYVVVEGDHLWGIAHRWVRLVNRSEPSEAEVREYWLALIETNATRMVEPGNPNLLLPGQELVLP